MAVAELVTRSRATHRSDQPGPCCHQPPTLFLILAHVRARTHTHAHARTHTRTHLDGDTLRDLQDPRFAVAHVERELLGRRGRPARIVWRVHHT